jgi:hypothetical protein
LPWIDRDAISLEQGIERGRTSFPPDTRIKVDKDGKVNEINYNPEMESEILSLLPTPITWKRAMEDIDDNTKNEMKNSYERSIHYIRILAILSELFYQENDLKAMTRLHSKLVNNKSISYTPTGISSQDFSEIKKAYGDGENFPELDAQTKLDLRRHDIIAHDLWSHQLRRKNGDMSVGEIILPWVPVP